MQVNKIKEKYQTTIASKRLHGYIGAGCSGGRAPEFKPQCFQKKKKI
jgi:hypothetical protein